jgi:hypothetical protein
VFASPPIIYFLKISNAAHSVYRETNQLPSSTSQIIILIKSREVGLYTKGGNGLNHKKNMFTGMGDGHSIYVPNSNQLELCPQNEFQDVR